MALESYRRTTLRTCRRTLRLRRMRRSDSPESDCDRIREAGCKQECASRGRKIEHEKRGSVMGLDSFVRE